MLWNAGFLTWHDYHTRVLTATVVTCTKSGQFKKNANVKWGGIPKAPPLAEELLAVDALGKRETLLCRGQVAHLIHMHRSSTNGTQWDF